MIDPIDVFVVRTIDPEWLGCAETLPRALEMIRESGTGTYFVFSTTTECNDFYIVDPDGELSLVETNSHLVQ
jgi:hypothetical protein